jgi:hypothetical protein
MSVNAKFVIERIRVQLGDSAEPHFWTDPELLIYIDEAQMEFCRQGAPIRDSRTPEICSIAYKADTFEIPYHEAIQRILTAVRIDSNGELHKVKLKNQENVLGLFARNLSDYGTSIDNTRLLNRPDDNFDLFTDYDEHYIRFSSPALTSGTLVFQVERLPKDVIDSCDDPLEVNRKYVPALIAWSCYRAWNVEDAETFDAKASTKSHDLFIDHAIRAKTEYERRHAQPGVVKYGGII